MLRSFFASLKPTRQFSTRPLRVLLPVLLLAVLLAACGAEASHNAAAPVTNGGNQSSSGDNGVAATPPDTTGGKELPTLPNGTAANTYLIRSLSVSLLVNHPLDAEQQITREVLAADPQAQAAGEEINQQGDGNYVVSLTFAISAPNYDAIKSYLNTFSTNHPDYKGKLVSEKESVQDVTSQYVDLQSRLTNLRTEQTRLLAFLSDAKMLSDALAVQDRLTDVEGQIEQIEGQINNLSSQISYSTVTITLSASPVQVTPPPAKPKPWNPGDVLGTAWSVLLVALQVLANVLIWVLVFAPLWLLGLGAFYLWRRHKQRRVSAAVSAAKSSELGTS